MSTQRHCGDHHIDWMMACGLAMAPFTLARPVLCQHCHGAPGMVTTFADAPFSTPAFEAPLLQGGELTWKAGPVVNGSNLCHGTGGNGYAFLKLYKRTRDPVWLERARAFAMAAIDQVRAVAPPSAGGGTLSGRGM
jgi:Lanthionine synthetase C-like protein